MNNIEEPTTVSGHQAACIPLDAGMFRGEDAQPLRDPAALIIEDDLDLQIILRYRFQRAGFHAVGKENGFGALAWMRRFTPRIIILDVLLPGLDGFGICRAIRNHDREEIRRVPIIMVTALPADENKRRGYQEGVDMFLRKPVLPGRVIQHAQALLHSDRYPRDLPAVEEPRRQTYPVPTEPDRSRG